MLADGLADEPLDVQAFERIERIRVAERREDEDARRQAELPQHPDNLEAAHARQDKV